MLTRPVRGWLRKTIGSLGPRLGTEIRIGSKMSGRHYPTGRGVEGLGTRLGRDNPTQPDSQK